MFKTSGSKFKTLKPGDDDFTFSPDGITIVPRAGFQLLSSCPQNYREIIQECISHGWLKPVAHMRDEEFTWEMLHQ